MRTTLTLTALTLALFACESTPLGEVNRPRGSACEVDGQCAYGLQCMAETCVKILDGAVTDVEPDPDPVTEPDPVTDPDPDPEPNPDPDPDPDPDPVTCTYPSAGPLNGVGDVLTPMTFTAIDDGAPLEVDLEDVYCNSNYRSVVFVMTTEWCPSCPSYMSALTSEVDAIEANDALLVLVSLEDRFYAEPDSAAADDYFGNYFSQGARVGAGVLDPNGVLDDMWNQVPNGFVVRTSDMKVIAHQQASNYTLDYVGMTADPERDWGNGAGGGDAEPVCAEGEDEASEPNDALGQAAVPSNGAICSSDPDWYEVTLTGDWRAELTFSHAAGDLDIELTNASGQRVSVAESADDDETLDGSGPGFLRVYGYNGATGPYGLSVSAR
jgi:hypothetical protein